MFIVILRYPVPDTTRPHLEAHTAWVKANSAAGRFLLTGPMTPRVGGIIVVDVPSRAELDAILAEDPYGKAGTTYEVHEFSALGGSLGEMGRAAQAQR